MFDADQIIYEAVAERMKDCPLLQQRRILQALLAKITLHHPAWKNVSTQLAMVESLIVLQQKLPLEFGPDRFAMRTGGNHS